VQIGVPLAEVRDAFGHVSVMMTERYAISHPKASVPRSTISRRERHVLVT